MYEQICELCNKLHQPSKIVIVDGSLSDIKYDRWLDTYVFGPRDS